MEERPRLKLVYEVGREISVNWMKHYNSSMAAAIAYRAMFSMIPLIVLLMMVVRLVQGGIRVVEQGWGFVPENVGTESISRLGEVIQASQEWQQIWSLDGWIIIVLSGVMIYGASLVFKELTIAVNKIWEINQSLSVGMALHQRVWSVLVVLGIGALVMGVMVVSWGLSLIESLVMEVWPGIVYVSQMVDWLVFPVVLMIGFGMGFKYLPRVKLKWTDVWGGVAITTGLFLVGQRVIMRIIQAADYTSYVGTAGSLIVFMMWVYYSAIIFLLGVEMTKIYAERWGSRKLG
jgi:membrane protein